MNTKDHRETRERVLQEEGFSGSYFGRRRVVLYSRRTEQSRQEGREMFELLMTQKLSGNDNFGTAFYVAVE